MTSSRQLVGPLLGAMLVLAACGDSQSSGGGGGGGAGGGGTGGTGGVGGVPDQGGGGSGGAAPCAALVDSCSLELPCCDGLTCSPGGACYDDSEACQQTTGEPCDDPGGAHCCDGWSCLEDEEGMEFLCTPPD